MLLQVMLIVGGYDDNQTWVNDTWCFIPMEETWMQLAPFPGRNRRFGCTSLGNDVYVVGGQASEECRVAETIADVWKYDSLTDSWSQVSIKVLPQHIGYTACLLKC